MLDNWVLIILVVGVLAVLGWTLFLRNRVPSGWLIGPWVHGKSYSEGLPKRPIPTAHGWKFDLPVGAQVDAVDRDTGPLPPNGRVCFQLRVVNPLGALIKPFEGPDLPATVALYFQRKGDDWSASEGRMEFFRWYCYPVVELMPGGGGLDVSFAPEAWFSVMGKPALDHMLEFKAALDNASRIGLTFGSPSLRSHGVVADKPVGFELLAWQIG